MEHRYNGTRCRGRGIHIFDFLEFLNFRGPAQQHKNLVGVQTYLIVLNSAPRCRDIRTHI
jgi:hypothetical protein